MFAVIIADNLTNDYCGSSPAFQDTIVNIGVDEIARLFGEEPEYQDGPLPVFLRAAAEAARNGTKIGTIFVV